MGLRRSAHEMFEGKEIFGSDSRYVPVTMSVKVFGATNSVLLHEQFRPEA